MLSIPCPSIGGFEFNDPIDLFCITLVASAVAVYFAWRLENSRLGRAWMETGEIVLEGTGQALLENDEVQRAYLG